MVFTVFYAHYAKDHLPKSNGREKAAKWTNMAAPSREPVIWVKRANMEEDMSQECTKIAEDLHKRALNLTTHWRKLS